MGYYFLTLAIQHQLAPVSFGFVIFTKSFLIPVDILASSTEIMFLSRHMPSFISRLVFFLIVLSYRQVIKVCIFPKQTYFLFVSSNHLNVSKKINFMEILIKKFRFPLAKKKLVSMLADR